MLANASSRLVCITGSWDHKEKNKDIGISHTEFYLLLQSSEAEHIKMKGENVYSSVSTVTPNNSSR